MKTSRALARDFSLCAERWNNDGRVRPRYVLYLLYLEQMIDRIVKTTTAPLVFLLRAEARGRAYPVLDFHWFVVLND